jgi:hypothetical protein
MHPPAWRIIAHSAELGQQSSGAGLPPARAATRADGSELARPSRRRPDETLVKALARAWRSSGCLMAVCTTSLVERAGAERISRSDVSRVPRLTLLAPEIG